MRYVSCDLCGADDSYTLYEKKKVPHAAGPVVRCKRCGLVYTNPREFERQWFDMPRIVDSYDELVQARTPVYQYRLAKIEKYEKGGKLLEIGCYTGAFLSMAKQRGWTCYGVEPSSVISDYAKNTYGIDIFPGFLSEAHFPADFFDAVVMFHVLEHLSSPRKELNEIHRILKPRGLLAIEVPNIDHPLHRLIKGPQLFFVPGHFYYFSPQTLSKLLNRAQFEVTSIEPSYKVLSVNRVINIIKRKLNKKMGQCVDVVAKKLKVSHVAPKIQTGLNVLVTAKPKPESA